MVADKVALFLIQLSCDGKAQAPFVRDQLTICFDVADEAKLRIAAASAFGTMVSIEDGSPLWRQRLMHLAAKHVLYADEEEKSHYQPVSALTGQELGRLMISCYIVASSRLTAMGEMTLGALGDIIIAGLSKVYGETTVSDTTVKTMGPLMFSVKELSLAAIVKLMAVVPKLVSFPVPTFV